MIDIQKFEELAKAASQGPWVALHPNAGQRGSEVAGPDRLNQICGDVAPSNALFIAAANPVAVLELIAELKGHRENPGIRAIQSLRGDVADLKAERDRLKAELEGRNKLCPCGREECALHMWPRRVSPEIERLRAENVGLRKISDRYEWITKNADVDCRGHVPDGDYSSLDERIDAAIAQEQQP